MSHASDPSAPAAPTVLLIAEAPIRALVHRVASRDGASSMHFQDAPDFRAALDRLGTDRPAAILLDLELRERFGHSSLEELRAAHTDAAIIALAQREEQAAAYRLLQQGAQDYLLLDELEPKLLARTIRHAIERQRRVATLTQQLSRLTASEARLRTIVSTTDDGLIIVDEAGRICYANPAAERLFGRTAAELLGEPFGYPISGGETIEIDVIPRGGHPIVVELRTTDTEWSGEPARLVALRDITERRKAQQQALRLVREQTAREQAEAAERRARFLSGAATVLAQSLDYGTTLRKVADLALPILGDWYLADIVGEDGGLERVAAVAADPSHAHLADAVARTRANARADIGVSSVLRSGKPELVIAPSDAFMAALLEPQDGDAHETRIDAVSALLLPLSARDRAIGTLTLLRTDPQRRHNTDDLALGAELARRAAVAIDNARLYEDAQQANRAKADFLAVMSHELRTPLNAVIGYADLLTMGIPARIPDGAIEQVKRIRSSARHLLTLIEEILSYSRIEAGQEEVRPEAVNLHEIAHDVADIVRPQAMAKQLELRIELDPACSSIHSDPAKLRQILLNLLSNAIKFTARGSVTLSLLPRDSESVEFIVADTGSGISKENVARIFDPFWQVEQSRTRRAEGTGLGLTVARRLARLLGGELTVTSEDGVGSRFLVVLPKVAEGVHRH